MRPDLSADVVVIGAGPAGAAACWRLAQHGLSVICLEQGHWLDETTLVPDMPGYERRRAGPLHENPNIRRGADDYPIDDAESPIKPTIGNGVGGGSIFWAAHIPRYRPEDFRSRSLGGVGEDWPIGYGDLVPYYELNERMMGLAAVPGDPAAPLRANPALPMPSPGPAGRRMAAAFDRLGWHWWAVDLAVGPEGGTDPLPCTHAGPCEAGCPARRRSGADRTYMRAALAAGVRLVTGARVLTLEHDRAGKVTAAVTATGAGRVRVRGERFVVAANGIGTPRLLLMSASATRPNGLANSSGLVGRNLMLHPHARVDGRFAQQLGSWTPGQKAGLVCLEFYASRPERGFPRGFKMQLSPAPAPAALAAGAGTGTPLPWGAAHHAGFMQHFDRIAGLTICAEDSPELENRVTLSDRLTDRDGAPAPKLSYRLSGESRRALEFAMDRAEEALREAGAEAIHRDPLKAQAGFHLMGTARMGADPDTSVVDGFGRCHDAKTLFVVDSSVFVTGGAMNPTATAQALALRAADHIVATRRA